VICVLARVATKRYTHCFHLNLPKRVGNNDRCGDTDRCGGAERAGDAERVGEKKALVPRQNRSRVCRCASPAKEKKSGSPMCWHSNPTSASRTTTLLRTRSQLPNPTSTSRTITNVQVSSTRSLLDRPPRQSSSARRSSARRSSARNPHRSARSHRSTH
jgi:hypothetical protein